MYRCVYMHHDDHSVYRSRKRSFTASWIWTLLFSSIPFDIYSQIGDHSIVHIPLDANKTSKKCKSKSSMPFLLYQNPVLLHIPLQPIRQLLPHGLCPRPPHTLQSRTDKRKQPLEFRLDSP